MFIGALPVKQTFDEKSEVLTVKEDEIFKKALPVKLRIEDKDDVSTVKND